MPRGSQKSECFSSLAVLVRTALGRVARVGLRALQGFRTRAGVAPLGELRLPLEWGLCNELVIVKSKKNAAAVALGRLGGLKGGKARARKLTAEQRRASARKAARARWSAAAEKTGKRS
jgi:hypothetical protein